MKIDEIPSLKKKKKNFNFLPQIKMKIASPYLPLSYLIPSLYIELDKILIALNDGVFLLYFVHSLN